MSEDVNKEVISYLNLKGENLEELKSDFNSRFVNRDNVRSDEDLVRKITGSTLGTKQTNIIKGVREKFGVELGDNERKVDGKDRPIEDIVNTLFEKQKQSYEEQINAARESASKDKTERELELEKQLADKNQEVANYVNLLDNTKSEYEKQKTDWQLSEQTRNFTSAEDKALSGLDIDRKDKMRLEGFVTSVKKEITYKNFDGKIMPVTKEGNMIPNPDKAGEFLTVDEAWKHYAEKLGMYNKNPHRGPSQTFKQEGLKPDTPDSSNSRHSAREKLNNSSTILS